jgi:hypothetical protein
MGHRVIGFDSDPLAVLLSSVWCSDLPCARVMAAAHRVIARATNDEDMSAKNAYPIGADRETKSFVRYWFDLRSRRQLTALSTAIARIRDPAIRSVLWCALSRMIITKEAGASLALDVSHSRPHRYFKIAPVQPIRAFLRAVDRILKLAPFVEKSGLHQVRVESADVRKLPLRDCSVDMVITSPPYLNAIDYLRGHKLSLIWMGHAIAQIRALRANNIGTEVAGKLTANSKIQRVAVAATRGRSLPPRLERILFRYVSDMDGMLRETARVLTARGRALIVIGDCSIRGVFVRNSQAIQMLAIDHGMKLQRRSHRLIPDSRRYLPPPRISSGEHLQKRLRREWVLSFCR